MFALVSSDKVNSNTRRAGRRSKRVVEADGGASAFVKLGCV